MPGRIETERDRELEAHYPVPRACRNIFSLILLILIGDLLILSIQDFITIVWGIRFAGDLVNWWIPICIAIIFFNFILRKVTIKDPEYKSIRAFLKDYWKRNVMGYRIEYFLDKEGKLDCHIFEKESEHDDICRDQYSIVFPIGGWFKKPEMYRSGNPVLYSGSKSFRTLRIRESNFCSGGFSGFSLPGVRLSDLHSDTHLDMRTALLFLNYFEWTVRSMIEAILKKIDSLEDDLKEHKGLVSKLGDQSIALGSLHESALGVINQSIIEIDGSKRYIKSKQAQAIRKWLQKEYDRLKKIDTIHHA